MLDSLKGLGFYALDRLTEASSWAGIAIVLGQAHVNFPPTVWGYVAQIGMNAAGLAAFFIKERSAAPTE